MKKFLNINAVLIILIFFVVGCAPDSEPTDIPTAPPLPLSPIEEPTSTPILYNVEISVTDENNNPISNAKIIQNSIVERTNNQGILQLSIQNAQLAINVWAQGYRFLDKIATLNPGDNKIAIQLTKDPFGLQPEYLLKEGYTLVFVEDFQDGLADCVLEGNGSVMPDETNPDNQLLQADLRGLDTNFSCGFGPVNIENAIIEVSFRYSSIDTANYVMGDYSNLQSYYMEFRDSFSINGFAQHVTEGPMLQIIDYSSGISTLTIPVRTTQLIEETQWYTLTGSYSGNKVEVLMDGTLKFTYLDPPTMTNTKASSIGAMQHANIQFDNIKMWVPTD